jgi:hypothetical protein
MATLEYAKAGTRRPLPRRVYWVAMGLFGWPTVVGVGITLLYLVTWWDRLPGLGALCVVGGLVSVFVGMAALAAYGWWDLRCGERPVRVVLTEVGLGVFLGVLNFPLAYLCAGVGHNAMTRVQVCFVNETNVPVTQIVLADDHSEFPMGDLPAGSRLVQTVHPVDGNAVDGWAMVGERKVGFAVLGYAQRTLPARKTVRFVSPTTAPVVR